ncbi:MAG TPA: amidophosphoribosyltransferase [Candidatus Polarisedimenticolaceae bacterium]|nr:amidophosphoribosyltransferase [Candidatus Polarisedimenticolaceae bacterium]
MCGIVGIFGHPEASTLAYLGLYALQHRGQESAGIVSGGGRELLRHAGMGHVADVFSRDALEQLPGSSAIGHVRYSTSGDSNTANAQPLLFRHHRGPIAVGHNGNLVNAAGLREELEADGSIFQTTSDTEVILHLAARARAADVVDALVEALRQVRGAYSLVFLVPGRLIAVRDPLGFRPLSLGRVDGAWVLASETCAFDLLGAEYVRDLARGELVVIDVAGVHSLKPFASERAAPCLFEHVYFARPDSMLFGSSVQEVRKQLGEQLWRERPADVDCVVPVPDSGIYAAIGYARASGLPLELGLVRNHYVGRTFIEPSQQIRNFGVRIKLNPVREVLRGRRIALIDDSIVRGTTSRKIVQLCRDAGASEVHLRISCPPTIGPCHYGIDTPHREELIASQQSLEQIRRYVNADSLGYLSLEGMLQAARTSAHDVCTACWTDDQPVALPLAQAAQLRLFEKSRR